MLNDIVSLKIVDKWRTIKKQKSKHNKTQSPQNHKEKTSEIEYEAKFLDINHNDLVKNYLDRSPVL